MTTMEVRQIDAWREGEGWTYNDSFYICDIKVKKPSTRTILRALRNKELLTEKHIYHVDDYFSYDGVWSVLSAKDEMPLYDVIERK